MAERVGKILIIDDEESIRDGCRQILSREGYRIEEVGDAVRGLEMALKDVYDIILLDVQMPKMSGLDVLRKLKMESDISAHIIIITGYGSIEIAVEAMKYGAFDFLTKPFSATELRKAVKNALNASSAERPEGDIPDLVGNSSYMEELKDTIRRVAYTDSTVLITGESGTGKELVAGAIQKLSSRKDKPFVPVDCSSLVENLMESELFGHVKGAFSGATQSREGRFQMADRGTLFLDEISNISLATQARLLRVIQEQEVPRVGSSRADKVDVRLLVATNKELRAQVDSGQFREDLFYRISVVPIDIKPLREHRSDIIPIAQHYLNIYIKKHKSKVKRFSEEAEKSLMLYNWPGNIRELKNTVERLCVLCENEIVNQSDILYFGQHKDMKVPVVDSHSGRMTLVDVEKEHIERALRHFDFQIGKTAKFLGIDRKTLRTKIKNYGIDTDR
ncbi:MAG: sigma-54-dependent Fis family transcriptional regulator [Deltaproteobacteria bacterium]|nr:sigma-54-dependent Fis family transcriptional regulator [Deltaproteobacteria bacterium]